MSKGKKHLLNAQRKIDIKYVFGNIKVSLSFSPFLLQE